MCGIGILLSSHSKRDADGEYFNELKRIQTCIKNRGPDSYMEHDLMNSHVTMLSSVLHMCGTSTQQQPVVGVNGDIFMWNGEIFGGIDLSQSDGDTMALFRQIQMDMGLLKVMNSIEGPWAFAYFNKQEDCLYFGRDYLGRRSLVISISKDQSSLHIASAIDIENNSAIALKTNGWIQFTPSALTNIYENPLCPGITNLKELPPVGIYCIRNLSDVKNGIMIDLIPFTINNQINHPISHIKKIGLSPLHNQLYAADSLLSLLETSVWNRLSTINHMNISTNVCVMFSGGIDCTILVCLICRLLKKYCLNWTIELASIAFGEDIENTEQSAGINLQEILPDRYTGYRSFHDLLRLFPEQSFEFIEINITSNDVMKAEKTIMNRILPHETQMDFQIACCYWLISQGYGRSWHVDVNNNMIAREQIEYSFIPAIKIIEEKKNGSCKTKNCHNEYDNECIMNMCSICCLRIQKRTIKPNKKNQQKCQKEMICLIHQNDNKSTSKPIPENSLDFSFNPLFNSYIIKSNVLFSGIGADELCGGYIRYYTAFNHGGMIEARKEMENDWNRLWFRNLGRDDRCISDHGREIRAPFLDEGVSTYLRSLDLETIVDFELKRGLGDKLILRHIATRLDLSFACVLSKRAIQFGSRIVKQYNSFMNNCLSDSKGSNSYIPMSGL